MVEVHVNEMKNAMKKFPLAEKMAKAAEMKKLQQHVTVMHTQQRHHVDKVEELHAKAERVTNIIHPMHQKVREVATSVESEMMEHVSFDLVDAKNRRSPHKNR